MGNARAKKQTTQAKPPYFLENIIGSKLSAIETNFLLISSMTELSRPIRSFMVEAYSTSLSSIVYNVSRALIAVPRFCNTPRDFNTYLGSDNTFTFLYALYLTLLDIII